MTQYMLIRADPKTKEEAQEKLRNIRKLEAMLAKRKKELYKFIDGGIDLSQ